MPGLGRWAFQAVLIITSPRPTTQHHRTQREKLYLLKCATIGLPLEGGVDFLSTGGNLLSTGGEGREREREREREGGGLGLWGFQAVLITGTV